MTELAVVADGKLEALFVSQIHQSLGLPRIQRKRLLDVYVATVLQAKAGNIEMILRWRGDVDDIRPSFAYHLRQVREIPFDREAFVELPCHQRFAVAHPDDLTAF